MLPEERWHLRVQDILDAVTRRRPTETGMLHRRQRAPLRTSLLGLLLLLPGLTLEAQVQERPPQPPFLQPPSSATHRTGPPVGLFPPVNEGEASWDQLAAGGVMGGLAGTALGVGAAALLTETRECSYDCIGYAALLVFGGGSLGIAAGVHAADRGQGSFAQRALISTGVGVGSVLLLGRWDARAVFAVPALQILALTVSRMRGGS